MLKKSRPTQYFITSYLVIFCARWSYFSSQSSILLVIPYSNFIWYRFPIPKHTFWNTWSTDPANTAQWYFAGNTMWYSKTVTLWLLCIYLIILPFYVTSSWEYNQKEFKINPYICVFDVAFNKLLTKKLLVSSKWFNLEE